MRDAIGAPYLADTCILHDSERVFGEQRVGHGYVHAQRTCSAQRVSGPRDGMAGARHVIEQDDGTTGYGNIGQRNFNIAITTAHLTADRVIESVARCSLSDPLRRFFVRPNQQRAGSAFCYQVCEQWRTTHDDGPLRRYRLLKR